MSRENPESAARTAGGTWRNIRQEVQPRAMSRQGRQRQVLAWCKAGALLTGTALAAWGVYEIVHTWTSDRATLAAAMRSAPLREVRVTTDGVLTQSWVCAYLAVPPRTPLMAIDLPALRNRLLQHGQIRGAVLTRVFPDRLALTLEERSPVARVRAVDPTGAATDMLVAKDGTPYAGVNYSPDLVATLPFLDGVRLMRSGAGFRPIEGMAAVSALLTTAQLQAPQLYEGWRVVSLARLAERREIVVRAQDVPEAVFTCDEDFFRQLARLDYIVDRVRRTPGTALAAVNLALGNQVPVSLDPALAPAPAAPSRSPVQRKVQRDL